MGNTSKKPHENSVSITTQQRQIILHYTYKIKLLIGYSSTFPHHFEGLKLWDSNIALARYVVMNTHRLKNNSVLQLPTGTGIVGISVRKWTQAKKIVMVDTTEQVVGNTRNNCLKNKIDSYVTAKMKWDEYASFNTKYDVILASDPFFHRCSPVLMVKIAEHFLTPGGTLIMAAPNSKNLQAFLKLSQQEKFEITRENVNSEQFMSSPTYNQVEGEKQFPQLCKGEILIYVLCNKKYGKVFREENKEMLATNVDKNIKIEQSKLIEKSDKKQDKKQQVAIPSSKEQQMVTKNQPVNIQPKELISEVSSQREAAVNNDEIGVAKIEQQAKVNQVLTINVGTDEVQQPAIKEVELETEPQSNQEVTHHQETIQEVQPQQKMQVQELQQKVEQLQEKVQELTIRQEQKFEQIKVQTTAAKQEEQIPQVKQDIVSPKQDQSQEHSEMKQPQPEAEERQNNEQILKQEEKEVTEIVQQQPQPDTSPDPILTEVETQAIHTQVQVTKQSQNQTTKIQHAVEESKEIIVAEQSPQKQSDSANIPSNIDQQVVGQPQKEQTINTEKQASTPVGEIETTNTIETQQATNTQQEIEIQSVANTQQAIEVINTQQEHPKVQQNQDSQLQAIHVEVTQNSEKKEEISEERKSSIENTTNQEGKPQIQQQENEQQKEEEGKQEKKGGKRKKKNKRKN